MIVTDITRARAGEAADALKKLCGGHRHPDVIRLYAARLREFGNDLEDETVDLSVAEAWALADLLNALEDAAVRPATPVAR